MTRAKFQNKRKDSIKIGIISIAIAQIIII